MPSSHRFNIESDPSESESNGKPRPHENGADTRRGSGTRSNRPDEKYRHDVSPNHLEEKRHYEESTSAQLIKVMQREQAAREDSDLHGTVELIPALSYGFGEWTARFEIAGPSGSYALKSISDFLERMRSGERYSYGKKLSFAHLPELFTERGRALARLLWRATTAQRNSERSGGRIARDLPLSQARLVELLDIMNGSTIDVTSADPRTRTLAHAPIDEGEPDLRLSIDPAGNGGYFIEAAEDARFIRSGETMFVWDSDGFHRCPATWTPCADFLSIALDPETRPIYIAPKDAGLFCATILPHAEKALRIEVPAELEILKPVPCTLRFYFDREGNEITCEARAFYGESEFHVGTDIDASAVPVRDQKREADAERLVERYFGENWLPAAAKLPLDEEERVAALLFGGLAEFRSLGDVHATPSFERLLRDKKIRISFGVSLAGNLLNLSVSADDLPPADLASLLSSYRKRKRYHRLRDDVFVDLKECDLSQLDRIARDLGIAPATLVRGSVELPSFRAFYLDEEADLERDRSFANYLERFRAVDERSYAVPPSLENVLRPYQAEGFRWLSARCDAGFGAILADEMGLGKSLQATALLLARSSQARAIGPSLIVCPASLVYNWLAELERFAPELRTQAVAGTKQERLRLIAQVPKAGQAQPSERSPERAQAQSSEQETEVESTASPSPCPYDVLMVSYDTLRIDANEFETRAFWCCILDEAQYIKNPAARVTRAAKRIHAEHRIALTGTPMENRLSDLWSIFDFLMPGILGPYARFRDRFELAIAGGDEDAAARLRRLVGPFMLRRRKEDVASDLPDKLESVVYVSLEGEQRKLYDACEQQLRERLTEQRRVKGGKGRAIPATPEARAAAATAAAAGDDFSKHRVEILAELTKLRQICCDPALLYEDYAGSAAKARVIADLVESTRDAGEKALVFSQFTGFLELIARQLDLRKIPHRSITGATPKRRRLELVDSFNEDDTPTLLISLKAGGTGLNLTGASVVIHADPWWNAAAQNQATDRTHRIGQTRTVTVRKIIAKGTIEERILRLQEMKAELADQVIGASGTSIAGLTREDLLELLES